MSFLKKIFISLNFLSFFFVSPIISENETETEENLDWFYFRSEYRELLKKKIQLEKSLIQLKLDYEKLEKENKSLSSKVIAYEEEIVGLHRDTLNYKREVESKLKQLNATIDSLKQEKLVLEAHVLELQRKQNEYFRQISERGLLEANLTKLETERNSILERYRELQSQIEKSQKENEALSLKLKETQDKQKQTENQLKITEQKLKELEAKQAKISETRPNSNETSKIDELNKKLQALAAEKETEISNLKKRISELEQENFSLTQNNPNDEANKEEIIEKLKQQIKILQKEKEEKISELNKKIEELKRDQESFLAYEGEISVLKEERERLYKMNSELLNTLEEIKSLVQGIEEHEAKLLDENESLKKEIQKLTQTQKKEIESNLSEEINKGDVQIQDKGKRIIINVFDKITFDSGSAKLKKEGKKTLSKLLKTLRKYNGQRLYIEGNTDNIPIRKGKYLDNWELSTARALSVVRFLIKNGIYPKYITACGNSFYNPIKPNNSETNRSFNRRVDIVVAPFE